MTFRIVNVRSDESVLVRDIDGAFKASILVSLLLQDDPNKVYQLGLEGQIRETGTDTWRSSFLLGPATTQARFYDVEVGTEYDIRFRFLYSNQTIGDWISSWDDLDDDGNVIGTNTSHIVVGNTRPPADPDGLTVEQTITGNVVFIPSAPWTPVDLRAFEVRYFAGFDHTDWDTMTPIAKSGSIPFEASYITSGDYTFAVKLLNYAVDPSGDPDELTYPQEYLESTNARFVNASIIDPRDIQVFMVAPTAPTAIDGTIATIASYTLSEQSDHADDLGIVHDRNAGTITMPATLTGTAYIRITGTMNIDLTVAGSPPDSTNIGLFLRSTANGDTYIGGNYIVDKANKQTTLPISTTVLNTVVATEVISLGLATIGGGSGNIGFTNGQFLFELILNP